MALGSGTIAHMSFSELSWSHTSFWLLLTHRGQVGVLGLLAFLGSDVAAGVRAAWDLNCLGSLLLAGVTWNRLLSFLTCKVGIMISSTSRTIVSSA